MQQLIDFEGLFEEKLAEYMRLHRGKYSEKQWEALIPRLYRQFGETYIPRAENTPRGYFAERSDEALCALLVRYLREGVRVPDFLCRELERRKPEALVSLLRAGAPAEEVRAAVEIFGAEAAAFGGYFRVLEGDADEETVEAVAECLRGNADAAKAGALDLYGRGVRPELMIEILSRVQERDDAVFRILLREFRGSVESGELIARAGYLARYGDPRATDALLEAIEREDIGYLEFRELRCAIETLGGVYETERDFSDDPAFQAISGKTE